jgi:Ni,Fe-hydrogenase III small subunit
MGSGPGGDANLLCQVAERTEQSIRAAFANAPAPRVVVADERCWQSARLL